MATGIATPELLSTADMKFPMENRAGFLAQSAPRPPILRGIALSPKVHMCPSQDGRIIVGRDFQGSLESIDHEQEA